MLGMTAFAIGEAAVVEGDGLPILRYVTGRTLALVMGGGAVWFMTVLAVGQPAVIKGDFGPIFSRDVAVGALALVMVGRGLLLMTANTVFHPHMVKTDHLPVLNDMADGTFAFIMVGGGQMTVNTFGGGACILTSGVTIITADFIMPTFQRKEGMVKIIAQEGDNLSVDG